MIMEGIFIINSNFRIELRCYSIIDFLDLKPKNDSTSLIICFFLLFSELLFIFIIFIISSNLYNTSD